MQVEQRKMDRMIVGIGRKRIDNDTLEGEEEDASYDAEASDDEGDCETAVGNDQLELEDWVSWIRRATNIAESHLRRTNVTDWVR